MIDKGSVKQILFYSGVWISLRNTFSLHQNVSQQQYEYPYFFSSGPGMSKYFSVTCIRQVSVSKFHPFTKNVKNQQV